MFFLPATRTTKIKYMLIFLLKSIYKPAPTNVCLCLGLPAEPSSTGSAPCLKSRRKSFKALRAMRNTQSNQLIIPRLWSSQLVHPKTKEAQMSAIQHTQMRRICDESWAKYVCHGKRIRLEGATRLDFWGQMSTVECRHHKTKSFAVYFLSQN